LPLNSAMTKSPSGLSRSMKRCYLISLARYWLVPLRRINIINNYN
jgi:hypothetical protein